MSPTVPHRSRAKFDRYFGDVPLKLKPCATNFFPSNLGVWRKEEVTFYFIELIRRWVPVRGEEEDYLQPPEQRTEK
jgi:hypothetical protein